MNTPLVREYVSDIVTVNEEQIAHAIMTLLEQEKTLAEGAGAVGFAALHYDKIEQINGKKVVVIISGGNIDMTMLALILERGLESDGRLARIRVVMPDKPGNIAELSAIIAKHNANILEISQNRSVGEVELGETMVEILLEARGKQHVDAITDDIHTHGYTIR